MSLKYYPSFRIKPNLNSTGKEFTLNGKPYVGKYYETYDGKFFSGANPIVGQNEQLSKNVSYPNSPGLNLPLLPNSSKRTLASTTKAQTGALDPTEPAGYQPKPLDSDYNRGYFNRYFVKKVNETGYIKEISVEEYNKIQDGSALYDVSFYQTEKILWKLTGPLNTVRLSQYDIRAGIVDTNKRLIETTDQRFLGLKTYIGDEYAKFSRPTQ
jgi:hypothetical protein